jgi:hypothetical protein
VAIAKAIEAAIGKRQGQRTDRGLPANSPEVQAGDETREIAAKKAGFGGATTYREARRVVENGVQELVEAMDAATTQTARRKAIYEALHPEARHRSSEKQSQRGAAKPAETVSPGFSADTAAKTGLTERTVQLYAQVGERLADDEAVPCGNGFRTDRDETVSPRIFCRHGGKSAGTPMQAKRFRLHSPRTLPPRQAWRPRAEEQRKKGLNVSADTVSALKEAIAWPPRSACLAPA